MRPKFAPTALRVLFAKWGIMWLLQKWHSFLHDISEFILCTLFAPSVCCEHHAPLGAGSVPSWQRSRWNPPRQVTCHGWWAICLWHSGISAPWRRVLNSKTAKFIQPKLHIFCKYRMLYAVASSLFKMCRLVRGWHSDVQFCVLSCKQVFWWSISLGKDLLNSEPQPIKT